MESSGDRHRRHRRHVRGRPREQQSPRRGERRRHFGEPEHVGDQHVAGRRPMADRGGQLRIASLGPLEPEHAARLHHEGSEQDRARHPPDAPDAVRPPYRRIENRPRGRGGDDRQQRRDGEEEPRAPLRAPGGRHHDGRAGEDQDGGRDEVAGHRPLRLGRDPWPVEQCQHERPRVRRARDAVGVVRPDSLHETPDREAHR